MFARTQLLPMSDVPLYGAAFLFSWLAIIVSLFPNTNQVGQHILLVIV